MFILICILSFVILAIYEIILPDIISVLQNRFNLHEYTINFIIFTIGLVTLYVVLCLYEYEI